MSDKGIFDMDYPDPDVIRVEDTYYMVTTKISVKTGTRKN
jgi:beta-xylosidase